jgi:hypothetical protein
MIRSNVKATPAQTAGTTTLIVHLICRLGNGRSAKIINMLLRWRTGSGVWKLDLLKKLLKLGLLLKMKNIGLLDRVQDMVHRDHVDQASFLNCRLPQLHQMRIWLLAQQEREYISVGPPLYQTNVRTNVTVDILGRHQNICHKSLKCHFS